MDSSWTEILKQAHRDRKMHLTNLFRTFSRKKPMENNLCESKTKLARCLSTLDLTALGIGSTLGVGVYVVAGSVAKTVAGPAVIISFAIAAFASMIAGLCYAEFGARVPKAGSAYIYSYVTVGEFIAFLIGWTLILEYVIGAASVVRGLSVYVDTFFNNSMRNAFESAAPINIAHLAKYPDFFAFGLTLIFSAALAFGTKESSFANNVFTVGNIAVVLFVIICGAFKADLSNWKITTECTEEDCSKGTGGFMPFGFAGILKGAATCFYAFIGFDCVATTGEEAKNPQRSIPIAIVTSLTVVFLAYFGVSSVLTTVLPYFDQNPEAPFPAMFEAIGWSWGRYIVTVGAVFGLCTSLLGAMFPLPRIIYAMASDGLIFKWMGKVNPYFHTPLVGTFSAGLLTGVLAAVFELSALIDMMSIGTLLAYSIVASCVLILRYEKSKSFEKRGDKEEYSFSSVVFQLINYKRLSYSTRLTSKLVTSLVFFYCVISVGLAALIANHSDEIANGSTLHVSLVGISAAAVVLILIFIYLQPNSDRRLTFSVPFVPFVPGLSILINVYLMMMLDIMTWMRFIIWMAIGLAIYFGYGVWNSNLRKNVLPRSVIKLSNTSHT